MFPAKDVKGKLRLPSLDLQIGAGSENMTGKTLWGLQVSES